MSSHLDDLVHRIDDPSMLLLSEFGSDLPVGRSSTVPCLMDPRASTIPTFTVHVVTRPSDKDQGRYLRDALLFARLCNLVHGFPDTCVDGTKTFSPTHFPMDLAHTSRRRLCEDFPQADHLSSFGIIRIINQSSGGITNHKHIDLTFRWAVHMAEDGLGNGFKQFEDTLVGLEILLDVRTKACVDHNVNRLLAPAERLDPCNAILIGDGHTGRPQLLQAFLPLHDALVD